jgi:hypothetical protein
MATNLPATQTQSSAEIIERVLLVGDLAELKPQERVNYYRAVCESLGLNPFTRPFEYIKLNGKLVLYARRDCTDQLRRLHRISVTISSRERLDETYIVTARATDSDGRTDEAIGAVSLKGASGEMLANLLMKAETKAKRRATLSLVGLGWLDETEVETIADARPAVVDAQTGEIENSPPSPLPSSANAKHPSDWTTRESYIKRVHAIIAAEMDRTGLTFPANGKESAYERIKAEQLGIAHLSEYKGTPESLKAEIVSWFNAEVERQAAQSSGG